MDVLSDVLKAVRLTGAIFFERHVHAPFAGESPPSAAIASVVMPDAKHMISFHAILSGSCWAALAGGSDSSARFNAGDIVIYPRGDANVLSSAPGMRGVPDFEQYCRLKGRPLPIVTHHNDGGAGYCHLDCSTGTLDTRCGLSTGNLQSPGRWPCWPAKWGSPGRSLPIALPVMSASHRCTISVDGACSLRSGV